MDKYLNAVRFQAGIGNNLTSQTRIGLIQAYNPQDGSVKVVIQPVDDGDPNNGQTGWIPLATNFIGLVGAPKQNDQVIVLFHQGNVNNGIVIGRLYSQADPSPQVPEGEYWITHDSGTSFKIKNDGSVEINGASKISLISPEIDLSNNGTVKKLVTDAMVDFFNNHTHGASPPPNTPMGNSELTTIVNAE